MTNPTMTAEALIEDSKTIGRAYSAADRLTKLPVPVEWSIVREYATVLDANLSSASAAWKRIESFIRPQTDRTRRDIPAHAEAIKFAMDISSAFHAADASAVDDHEKIYELSHLITETQFPVDFLTREAAKTERQFAAEGLARASGTIRESRFWATVEPASGFLPTPIEGTLKEIQYVMGREKKSKDGPKWTPMRHDMLRKSHKTGTVCVVECVGRFELYVKTKREFDRMSGKLKEFRAAPST